MVLVPVTGGLADTVSEPDQIDTGKDTARLPSASADGRFVSFLSNGSNLVSGLPPASHVFLRDRHLGVTYVADPNSDVDASSKQLSANGPTLIFVSRGGLIVGDLNGVHDPHRAILTGDPVPADPDGDGLPDAWERKYFYGLDFGPAVDVDRNGSSNPDEFLAGTSPTRPQINLNLSPTMIGTNSLISLSLSPENTSALRVYWRRDLDEPWMILRTHLIGRENFETSYPIAREAEGGSIRFDF